MRIPDAISEIRWPEGWVDGPLAVRPEVMTLALKTGGTATIVTACTDKGTSLLAMDAPGVQKVGRMTVIQTPMGCMGAPLEVEHRGRPLTRDTDKPLVDAWEAVERSFEKSRAWAESGFEAPNEQ